MGLNRKSLMFTPHTFTNTTHTIPKKHSIINSQTKSESVVLVPLTSDAGRNMSTYTNLLPHHFPLPMPCHTTPLTNVQAHTHTRAYSA